MVAAGDGATDCAAERMGGVRSVSLSGWGAGVVLAAAGAAAGAVVGTGDAGGWAGAGTPSDLVASDACMALTAASTGVAAGFLIAGAAGKAGAASGATGASVAGRSSRV